MKLCMHCFHKLTEEDAVCPHCHKNTEESAPVHHLKPGTVLMDRYVVGHALGEGGFGITYIGWDETLKMRVAIKEYFPNGFSIRNHNVSDTVELTKGKVELDFRGEMDRFLQEAQRLAKFSSKPGVVSIYNYFQANNTAYIVMEYLDGVTLMDVLRQKKRLSPDSLFRVLDPVMQALELVHEEDLIHRDISPDNIMVLRDNTLKLLDFGAARDVSNGHSLSVVLKPGYAPEEQYRTKGKQGPWTDIYALCATMYKCITGITPSVSLDRIAEDDLKKPSQLGIDIDPSQEAALIKGLSLRMSDRFQTVRELRIALGLAPEEESLHSTHLFSDGDDGNDPPPKTTKTTETTPADEGPGLTVLDRDPGDDGNGTSGDDGNGTSGDDGNGTSGDDGNGTSGDGGKGISGDNGNKTDSDTGDKTDTGRKGFPRKLIFLLLAVIAVCASVFTVSSLLKAPKETLSPLSGDDSYTVSPVGQIAGELKFDGDVVYRKEGNLRQLIDLNGNAVLDMNCTNIRYLQDDLYLVRDASNDVNNLHLISRDGQRYWDTPAAMANWITYTDTHHRYLLVYFADAVTTDPENCFLSHTGNNLYYTTPVDNATMYTGYALAYDLEQMRFVPNLPGITNVSSVDVCGDSLLWGESYSALSLWNAEGECIDQLESAPHVGDGYYLVYANSTYRIYDQEGNQTYASNKAVNVIENSGLFQIRTDDSTKIPIDPWGNPLFTTGYESFDGMICGNLLVRQEGKYGLLSLTGEVVVPIKYDHISQINDWYYYAKYGDSYTLFSPEGIIATGLDQAPSELIVDTDDRALVLNKRETYVDVSGGHKWLTDALITVCDSFNGLYGAADLFAGVRILPCEYEQIHYAAGYLYGYKNGTWEVFELTYNPEHKTADVQNVAEETLLPKEDSASKSPATTVPTAESRVKTGLAMITTVGKSTSASADAEGEAKYDVTLVAVNVDDNGVITSCVIDSIGASVRFDASGAITSDLTAPIATKNELGEAYGMKAYAGAQYEWNEQAAALAAFAVGKTVDEVMAGISGGYASDVDLATTATIYLGGYVSGIEAAVANAHHLGAQAGDKLILSTLISAADSKAANAENAGNAQLNVDAVAMTMNGDVITSAIIDAVQAKVAFDATGAITSDVSAPIQTKNQLGEGYGMKAYAGAKYEWNEQSANFCAYITGKTAADVSGISVTETTAPAEGSDLASSVTIAIGNFLALIAKATQQ